MIKVTKKKKENLIAAPKGRENKTCLEDSVATLRLSPLKSDMNHQVENKEMKNLEKQSPKHGARFVKVKEEIEETGALAKAASRQLPRPKRHVSVSL